METSIIISGFGGQGALFAGQLLAHAALESGREVTWIPSYGPEMRGGTAHCTVIVGDEPIGSPLVRNPHCVIALNLPSADKYEPLVQAGGILIADGTVVRRAFQRDDILTLAVPAHAIAIQLGDSRLVNVTMLGVTAAGMQCADPGGGGGGAAQAAAGPGTATCCRRTSARCMQGRSGRRSTQRRRWWDYTPV